MTAMHAARLDRSGRLQRAHKLLSDGQEHSTSDIRSGAHIEAVSATIAELRERGAKIDCRQTSTVSGSRVWLYRMTQPALKPDLDRTDRRTGPGQSPDSGAGGAPGAVSAEAATTHHPSPAAAPDSEPRQLGLPW